MSAGTLKSLMHLAYILQQFDPPISFDWESFIVKHCESFLGIAYASHFDILVAIKRCSGQSFGTKCDLND